VPVEVASPVNTWVVPLESLVVPPELSATERLLSPPLPGKARLDARAVLSVLLPAPKLRPERPRARPMLAVGAFWSAMANELLLPPLRSRTCVVVVAVFVPVALALPVSIVDVPSEWFEAVPVLTSLDIALAPV